MKTIEIILKGEPDEVVFTNDVPDEEAADLLYRARLQAELWTRDKDGEYEAREKPEPVEG